MPPYLETLITLIVTVVCSVLASSGFWAYFQSKHSNKDSRLELLLGLAHDRIIHVGQQYIDRGWITYDEYEDFQKYLYEPYVKFGGNGLARRVEQEVSKLPVRSNTQASQSRKGIHHERDSSAFGHDKLKHEPDQ